MDRALLRFVTKTAVATVVAFALGLAIWYFAAEHSPERLGPVLFWCGAGWISVATVLFAGASDEYVAPPLSERFTAPRDGRGIPYASDLRYASARAFLIMFVPGTLLIVASVILWWLSK